MSTKQTSGGETVFPPGDPIAVGGDLVEVKPLGMADSIRFSRLLSYYFGSLDAADATIEMIESDLPEKALYQAIAIATGRPRDWAEALGADDLLPLLRKLMEVNGDFFGRKLVPLITGVIEQIGLTMQQIATQTSSRDSKQPGGVLPKSGH